MNDKNDLYGDDCCPHCGAPKQFGLLDAETGDVPVPIMPYKRTFYTDLTVEVEMPAHMSMTGAARGAISYVRNHMRSLPDGYRIVQACPRKRMDASGDTVALRHLPWIVRCTIIRESEELDNGWEDLLDLDDIPSINRGARLGWR
jgi:hypothetical protein